MQMIPLVENSFIKSIILSISEDFLNAKKIHKENKQRISIFDVMLVKKHTRLHCTYVYNCIIAINIVVERSPLSKQYHWMHNICLRMNNFKTQWF